MEIQIPGLLRIKPYALNKIGKYLRKAGFLNVALFYGKDIKELLGERVSISLDSAEIRVIYEESIADNKIEEIFRSVVKLPRGTEAILAVGGGLAIDYAKYIAFLAQLPVISIPTAISNDGFASPMASLYVEGKRKSLKAKIPWGVILDTDVISHSPARFSYSGIGDLVSKYSAVSDWKLAYHSVGEPVNDFAVMTSLQSVENLVNYPVKSINDLEFVRLVCGALVMSGVSMEVCGSSRPASGSEHLISHAYDKLAKKPSMHGLQVGVATLAVTWLQEHPKRQLILDVLEETGFNSYMEQNPLDKEDFIRAVMAAPSIKEGYYTILSVPGNQDKLVTELQTNPFWNRYLK